MDRLIFVNEGSETREQTFHLSYKKRTASTWKRNISLEASIETTFEACIPFIEQGKVQVGVQVTGQLMWEECKDEITKHSFYYKTRIPPNTMVTAQVQATHGFFDVPFSYTQHDVLHTGKTVITQMDDGVYTGISRYSFFTEIKEESMIDDPDLRPAEFKKVATELSPSGEIIPI